MLRHLPLIWKNSVRNKRRSVFTILSIAASFCLLGVLMALYHSFYFKGASAEQSYRLISRNRVSLANPLPISYGARIRQVPGVQEAMVWQWYGGTYKDSRDMANFFARFAVEPEKMQTLYPEMKMPEDQWQAFIHERTACIVGMKTAARHNLKIGDRISLVGDIFPVNLQLTIRGIFDNPSDNESMIFNFEYLNKSVSEARADKVGTFTIRLQRPEDAATVAKAIDAMFRNSTEQTKTETEKEFEISFLAFLGNVKLFLLSICGAVTFTMLLVAGNTMAMSVRERVREVGILKTLGFTPGGILSMIVGESIVIALIGGVIGLGLAYLICALIRQMPSTFANLSAITVPPPVAGLCLLIAATAGALSCLVPAWTASRRPIVESLRFND